MSSCKAHANAVVTLAVRADQTTIVSVARGDDVPVAWQLPTLKQAFKYAECSENITCFTISGNGRSAWAGCRDGMIRRYDAANGHLQVWQKGGEKKKKKKKKGEAEREGVREGKIVSHVGMYG